MSIALSVPVVDASITPEDAEFLAACAALYRPLPRPSAPHVTVNQPTLTYRPFEALAGVK